MHPIGHYKLLIALLQRALLDATSLANNNKKERRRARSWINNNDDYPFTFIWVCDHLLLESDKVRRELLILADTPKQKLKRTKKSTNIHGVDMVLEGLLGIDDYYYD